MSDVERLRERLALAGASLPDGILELVAGMVGTMLLAHDALAALDLHDVEPFVPTCLVNETEP